MPINVTINPNRYLAEFQKAISNHIAAMRNTLRTLENGSFEQNAITSRSGTVVQIQLNYDVTVESSGAICNRCFLDLTRELITYLDRMIALKRCTGQEMKVPRGLSSHAELASFIENRVSAIYDEVARDRALTNPKKLEEFPKLPEMAKKSALTYFGLRRTLEHHGGTPNRDVTIHVYKLTILAGNEPIEKLPFHAKEASRIGIRTDQIELKFPAGQPVALTEQDLEGIFFTLQSIVGPEVPKAL